MTRTALKQMIAEEKLANNVPPEIASTLPALEIDKDATVTKAKTAAAQVKAAQDIVETQVTALADWHAMTADKTALGFPYTVDAPVPALSEPF